MKQMMILNEKEYIKNLYDNDIMIEDFPKLTLDLLAIYLWDYLGLNQEKIVEELQKFIADRYSGYTKNKSFWDSYAEKAAKAQEKNANGKNPKGVRIRLLECAGIPITQSEIETIKSISDKMNIDETTAKAYQRLLFTILCVGKFQRMKDGANQDGYTNTKDNALFELARVTAKEEERDYILGSLAEAGYVAFPYSKKRVNVRPTFIDDSSEVVHVISDMREIGWKWNQINGEFYRKCDSCGLLMSPRIYLPRGLCKQCEENNLIEYVRCEDCNTLFMRLKTTATRKRCLVCQHKRNQQKKNESKKRTKMKQEKNAEC